MLGSVWAESPDPVLQRPDVEAGMTRAEVISVWGEPRGSATSGSIEILHYRRDREVELRDGIVVSVVGEASITTPRRAVLDRAELDLTAWSAVGTWEGATEPGWLDWVVLAVSLGVALLNVAAVWRIYSKAGERGWACLIPIYNLYVWIRMAGRPTWWLLLFLVPFVNVVIGWLVLLGIARQFGKGIGYALGLLFLPFIFYPVLGFGAATHTDPRVRN